MAKLDITDELIAERRAEEPGQTPEDMTPWQRPITAFIDVLNLSGRPDHPVLLDTSHHCDGV